MPPQARRPHEVSTIVRLLECLACTRRFNWLDPTTPKVCPYCAQPFGPLSHPREVRKYVAKVPYEP